jgi:putative ABC transport system permease protein
VTPGYFEAVGTRLVSGRDFDWTDLELGRLVTIVDEALAAKAWPGEDPLGKRLRIEVWSTRNGPIHLEPLWTEVVGVVEEVRSATLDRADGETVYLPYGLYAVSELSLLVRSDAEPAFLSERIRDTFSRIDPDLAVFNFRVMDEWVAESVAPRRFTLSLLTAFGIAGLSLALVGIYGVLASSVNLRRRELGIRLALGARPAEALRLVMARGARLTVIGLVLGLVGASGLARLLSRQLYGVGPNDLLVYTSVAATIVLVSLAACYVPARRAARIDPMKILRLE